ncbi:ribosome silencing factor [Pleomorphomonas diazotrophica]|uniref:Ribosomal silencing factor RsfS n=1 Tax=Pleomorphomonas diazotrophica TaxID=1166257 RepID=A0A1I4SZJ4_9HYPH|nr:ribosome silencing factor [Pleomorphomonas diazotrophica]PKR88638.1 ribosome silencing factor [Pleomorphomonas diazotrophica]SFM69807.1 ribosome-associated protein [Pleomorphomonas diazotrophica]
MPFTEGAFSANSFADVAAFSGDATPLPRSLLDTILASLDDAKAEDVVDIDVAAKTPIADHMVICTGRSSRHVGAIADHLVKDLKDAGFGSVAVEGQPACDWVLIDAGSIIVHVFRPEVREFYHLEKMWAPDPAPTTGRR